MVRCNRTDKWEKMKCDCCGLEVEYKYLPPENGMYHTSSHYTGTSLDYIYKKYKGKFYDINVHLDEVNWRLFYLCEVCFKKYEKNVSKEINTLFKKRVI